MENSGQKKIICGGGMEVESLGSHEKAIPERAIRPRQSTFTFLLNDQHLFPDVSLCWLCSLCLFTCKASLHVAQQMPSTALQFARDRLCLWGSYNCNLAMLAPKSVRSSLQKAPPQCTDRWCSGSVSFSPWWQQLTWKQLFSLIYIIIAPQSGLANVENICLPSIPFFHL